jgi:hypothetical protein
VSDGVWCAQSVQLAQGPVGAGDGPGHGDLPVHRLVEVDGDRRARGVEAGRPVRELVGLHEEQLGPGAAAIHDAGDDLAGHRRTVVLMRHRHLHPFVGGAGLERSEPVGLPELSPCQPLLRPTSPKPFSMSRIVMRPPRLGSRHDGKRRSTHRRHRLTSSRAGDARGLRVVETPSWGRRRDHCERTDKERCVANVSSFATPRSAIERRSPASPSREGMLQRLLRCVRSVASAFIRTSFTCHRPNAPRSRHPRGGSSPGEGHDLRSPRDRWPPCSAKTAGRRGSAAREELEHAGPSHLRAGRHRHEVVRREGHDAPQPSRRLQLSF